MTVASLVADPSRALRWTNRYATLGDAFYTRLAPLGVPDPHWVATSDACGALLGLPPGWQADPRWNALAVLAGNAQWPGMEPLASAYGGHQFGVWAGQLGDGRAHWLGEIDTPHGPMEIQLKGAGLTPYSRMGDGRAVLRSSIREFLCSEAMAALGIPTTRALAVVGSPLPVRRERIESAAVATRVSPSFLRFGHFEHFAHHDQHDALRRLADFAIDTYFPECRETDQPVVALLDAVSRRTATLIAEWQAVGFCHGVMNTDNMSLLGLTIDYGPFGFLDAFDPGHVCNHSDTQGRYAYARQANVAFWNLHALAQALLPLIGDEEAAVDALAPYKTAFPQALMGRMRDKLGLLDDEPGDQALVDDLLRRMAADRADFTITFRRLARFSSEPGARNDALRDLFLDRGAFDAWAVRYAERLRREASVDAERAVRMDAENPRIVLRNHLAETAIRAAEGGDFGELRRLHAALQRPYDDTPESDAYAGFPPDWASGLEVSCSS